MDGGVERVELEEIAMRLARRRARTVVASFLEIVKALARTIRGLRSFREILRKCAEAWQEVIGDPVDPVAYGGVGVVDDQRERFCTRGRIVPGERGRNVLAFAGELFRDFLAGSEVGAFELEGHGCGTSRRIGSAGKGYREDDGQRSAGWFGVHRGILALDGQSGNQKPKNGKGKGDTWRAAGKVALRRSRCGGRADAEEVGDHRVTALGGKGQCGLAVVGFYVSIGTMGEQQFEDLEMAIRSGAEKRRVAGAVAVIGIECAFQEPADNFGVAGGNGGGERVVTAAVRSDGVDVGAFFGEVTRRLEVTEETGKSEDREAVCGKGFGEQGIRVD